MSHYPTKQTLSQQQGFTILESIVVLSVVVSLMSLGARYVTQNAEREVNQATAQQLKQVASAAHHYVQDHYNDLKTGATIDFDTLVTEGYLAQRIQESNLYGQHYVIEVTPSAGQQLQVTLTTEGGQVIAEHSLRQIANLVGGDGGYTSTLQPGKIIGSQGAWEVSGVSLAAGHLASVMMVNENDLMNASDFLRRKKNTAHPEYNKMEADLQMDDAIKLFFGQEGMQLSKYELKSTHGNNSKVTLQNDSSGAFLEMEGPYDSAGLYTNKLHLKDKNHTNRETTLWKTQFEMKNDQSKIPLVTDPNPSIAVDYANSSLTLQPNHIEFSNKQSKAGRVAINGDVDGGYVEIENADSKMELFTNRLKLEDKKIKLI